MKNELSELSFQKYAINRFCSSRSQLIMALTNLRSHGITEEQIISLNNFLESNGYKTSSYTVQTNAVYKPLAHIENGLSSRLHSKPEIGLEPLVAVTCKLMDVENVVLPF